MSCSDTCTSYNQRTSHFATAWFHLVLAQWNWMQRQKWCQWHGPISATFILLPLLSRPRDIRYSKMTLACVSLSTIYMLLSQFDIEFCLLVISRKCSITWVTYCVRLLGLTLSPCNLMLELLESTLDWWLFAHIIRYNYWDCLIISFFPSSILNWIAYKYFVSQECIQTENLDSVDGNCRQEGTITAMCASFLSRLMEQTLLALQCVGWKLCQLELMPRETSTLQS